MREMQKKNDFSFHFQDGGTIYYEFRFLGCQGDRTPMYRAFAPFWEGDKGDRRVTGCTTFNNNLMITIHRIV
jgi:hypothetical protein